MITRLVLNTLAWAAFAFLCLSEPAPAQQVNMYWASGSGLTTWNPVSAANPLPVSASASISGFTAATLGTPITADTNGETGTLPAGAVVVATNTGAVPAYCQLGASSSTNGQYIAPSGGWFAFTVLANTQITCTTASSTAIINLVGGAGLPTGTGGGGGAGGGGAVTLASGAVSSGAYSSGSIASGAVASGAFASGALASGSIAAGAQVDLLTMRGTKNAGTAAANSLLAGGVYNSTPLTLTDTQQASLQFTANGYLQTNVANANANGQATMANSSPVVIASNQASIPVAATLTAETTKVIGTARTADGSGNLYLADPCQRAAKTTTPISITTATTTRIVAPSASNRTYICNIFLTSAAADNVGIVEGTGGTCGSGTAGVIGGTTAANGPNFAANSGIGLGNGGFFIAATAGTNVDLCLITSAATPLAGVITWVQLP